MEKIIIKKLIVSDKSKDGTPFVSKKGQPYKKVNLSDGSKWYSCFQGAWNSSWSEGQEIEVEVEAKEYNGKTFYNIKAPQRSGGFGGNTQALEGLLGSIDTKLSTLIELLKGKSNGNSQEEDIPF